MSKKNKKNNEVTIEDRVVSFVERNKNAFIHDIERASMNAILRFDLADQLRLINWMQDPKMFYKIGVKIYNRLLEELPYEVIRDAEENRSTAVTIVENKMREIADDLF